jgi:hypothetical protein
VKILLSLTALAGSLAFLLEGFAARALEYL